MQFPDALFDQYKAAMVKFKKTQKTMFRRFGSNLPMTEELGSVLAPKFDHSDLPEYAGLCWMAAAKCEQDLENKVTAVDYLIKAGKAFVRADERSNELNGNSNSHENLTAAIRCYNEALGLVADDSAMRAGITIKKRTCSNNWDLSSNFVSATHRIHDLDISARKHIRSGNHHAALEQLTEIFDILQEEKSEEYYHHTTARAEVLILLLLLLLKLPPARQSPIHMKISNKYAADNRNVLAERISNSMTDDYLLALQNLVFVTCACSSDSLKDEVAAARFEVLSHCSAAMASHEHLLLLEELANDK